MVMRALSQDKNAVCGLHSSTETSNSSGCLTLGEENLEAVPVVDQQQDRK
ncbi:hypothetical protein KP79_PYT06938 [Mizuhopecten yessoensis]|uniref:Uncharacterized protein n=1 Tax=Mizuhopecten yessoensis TaxID=6573 RepID=A0A210PW68_MIZYE|nr:hypothetical protein KP79_PYT06938 [Mizuhopecten yessoensis]